MTTKLMLRQRKHSCKCDKLEIMIKQLALKIYIQVIMHSYNATIWIKKTTKPKVTDLYDYHLKMDGRYH